MTTRLMSNPTRHLNESLRWATAIGLALMTPVALNAQTTVQAGISVSGSSLVISAMPNGALAGNLSGGNVTIVWPTSYSITLGAVTSAVGSWALQDAGTSGDSTWENFGFTSTATIEGESTRSYAGASRTTIYASFSQYGTQLTYYWDKQTGAMVEVSGDWGDVTLAGTATETNMWQAGPPEEAQTRWPLIIGIIIVVAVIGVTAVFYVRRMHLKNVRKRVHSKRRRHPRK
jgi:hypothetical protein